MGTFANSKRRCNLRCLHCYSSSGPEVDESLPIDVLTTAVEDAAGLGYRALAAGRRVVITGVLNRILALGGRYAPHSLTLPATAALMSRR